MHRVVQRKMSDRGFRIMQGVYKVVDHIHPHVATRVASFDVKPGQTIVDYGCGPGRYAVEFAKAVGPGGRVIAVDLVDLALIKTKERFQDSGLHNYDLVLAQRYDTGISDNTADTVFAIDMFHHVSDSEAFLREVLRIAKPEALLVFSGGHMPRRRLKTKVAKSGLWELHEETRHYVSYRPPANNA